MNLSRLKTIFFVNLKLCLLEIYTNRSRTFITTLGIFMGIAALLVNLAFVRGMDDDLRANMERIGGLNIITVRKVEPVTAEEKMQFQNSPGLSIEEALEIADEVPYVTSVIIKKDLSWSRIKAKGNRTHGKLIAVTNEYLRAYNYAVAKGRTFSDEDMIRHRQVCLIGRRLSKRLFGEGYNPVGETIRIKKIPVQIIGVIHTENDRNERAAECIFPYSVYAMRFRDAKRNMSEISLLLESSSYARKAQNDLAKLFQAKHRGVKDFEVEASIDKLKEMETAALGMKIILWSIASISLIVGGISIMNIMFATIGDRIREIGIRKALGAQPLDVFTQFLIEAVLVCIVGAIPGILLGSSVTLAPEDFFPYIPRLTILDYSIAFGFTIAAGIFSGMFPALKAARMQPVEALRY